MSYKDWFRDLDIDDDIESVHSLYLSIKGRESVGEFEVTQVGSAIKVDAPFCDPYTFKRKEADKFTNWLNEIYPPSVEIRRYEAHENAKND